MTEIIDVHPLKKMISKLPNCALKEAILAEDDFIEVERFIAPPPLWLARLLQSEMR